MHQTEDVGKKKTFGWLREGYLKSERESMIIAAQDKSISPLGLPCRTKSDVHTARRYFRGFGLLTAVTMGSITVWNITLYIQIKIHRRFGGACYLHFHGRIFSLL
jgi:hypothetical protein